MAGMPIMTPRQARAARAVLRLSVRELAEQSGVSDSSIRRIEASSDETVTLDLLVRLQQFFETHGITFKFDNMTGICWPVESLSRRLE